MNSLGLTTCKGGGLADKTDLSGMLGVAPGMSIRAQLRRVVFYQLATTFDGSQGRKQNVVKAGSKAIYEVVMCYSASLASH